MGGKKHKKKTPRPPKAGIEWEGLKLSHKMALESERGCVVLGAAAIELAITRLIKAQSEINCGDNSAFDTIEWLLSPPPTGPLGSFWAKACLCRALGLISQDYLGLIDTLRLLRNEFSHLPYPVELTERDIANLLGDRESWKIMAETIAKRSAFWDEATQIGEAKAITEVRKRFVAICGVAEMYVVSREFYLRENHSKPWPELVKDWLPFALDKREQSQLA